MTILSKTFVNKCFTVEKNFFLNNNIKINVLEIWLIILTYIRITDLCHSNMQLL